MDKETEDVVADLLHGWLHDAKLLTPKQSPAVRTGESDEKSQNEGERHRVAMSFRLQRVHDGAALEQQLLHVPYPRQAVVFVECNSNVAQLRRLRLYAGQQISAQSFDSLAVLLAILLGLPHHHQIVRSGVIDLQTRLQLDFGVAIGFRHRNELIKIVSKKKKSIGRHKLRWNFGLQNFSPKLGPRQPAPVGLLNDLSGVLALLLDFLLFVSFISF